MGQIKEKSHSIPLGYLLWCFGFLGAHRFYFGKPKTGTLWFCTFGLLGVGWLIDIFLIPNMERDADLRYEKGKFDYNIGWILLTFFGFFGVHRFYLGRWISGLIWLCTGGLFFMGYLYDLWNLNEMISYENEESRALKSPSEHMRIET